jgi:hypothetical protein
MADFNPSSVEIIKAEIISYDNNTRRDISTNYIYSFDITQSMDAVAYSGSISVLDTSNLLEGMPIRGEESLNFWIVGKDKETEIKIAAIIHKVDGITPLANSGGMTYKIHFVSKQSFKASTKKVLTSFRSTSSEIARDIFIENFAKLGTVSYKDPDNERLILPYQTQIRAIIKEGDRKNEPDRNFIIQHTNNQARVVIPDLSPTEAMFFAASRAYNPDTPSQTFRFFETLENYYFCTDEYFIRKANNTTGKILELFFAPVTDLDAKNAEAQINRIEELHILSKGIDTSSDLFSGAYTNEVTELDFVKKRVDVKTFNYNDSKYIDMSGITRSVEDNPHTEKFRNDTFTKKNARKFMIFKNFTSPGDLPSALLPDQHLADIAHNRVSYYHHLNNTSLVALMKGRLDIRPGMIANLSIKKLNSVSNNVEANDSLSGRYLVQKTVHSMDDQGTLNTTLKLAKFDWSGRKQLAQNQTADIPDGERNV